jgi:hypothetical protein
LGFSSGRISLSKQFDDLVSEFLARPKFLRARARWRTRSHADYAELRGCVTTEAVDGLRSMRGHLVLTAHRVRQPPKYGFALLFQGRRICGLDVDPGRFHRNILTRKSVGMTHWHRWPDMAAESDDRISFYNKWLNEFVTSLNISCKIHIKSPPYGVQLRLDEWNPR